MSESNEKQATFLGTYFDRDGGPAPVALGGYRCMGHIDGLCFVVAVFVPAIPWAIFEWLYFDKGATFLTILNMFAPYFQQPLPGIFYFFGLQAVSKGMLIFLDMEDNTRRAARK